MNTDEMTDDQLEKEILRPPRKFKGVELWPWSRAARHCWRMVCTDGKDLAVYQWLSMLWILTKRSDNAEDDFEQVVIPLCYDIGKFRATILKWRNELSEEDELEAMKICEEILALEIASRSVVQPEPGSKKSRRINRGS